LFEEENNAEKTKVCCWQQFTKNFSKKFQNQNKEIKQKCTKYKELFKISGII
jgi:hypothetical protein